MSWVTKYSFLCAVVFSRAITSRTWTWCVRTIVLWLRRCRTWRRSASTSGWNAATTTHTDSCVKVNLLVSWDLLTAKLAAMSNDIDVSHQPRVGPGPEWTSLLFSPLSIYLIFCFFFFFSFLIRLTYFFLLSIPSLSIRIVSLRFQTGGRRRRLNPG